ncbi:MAG: hypothetical protein V4677_04585 [Bacteroidota bacterium]
MKTKTLFSTCGALVFAAVAFVSCSTTQETEILTLIDKIQVTNEDTTDGSQKFVGDAHGGKYFSHTDSASGQYGTCTVYNIHDSLMQKGIRVKINMWVKQGAFSESNQFAVSLQDNEGIIKWEAIALKNHLGEDNKWINVIDSISFPQELVNKNGLYLKMFLFNPDLKSYLDVDDEEISIYKVDKVMVD